MVASHGQPGVCMDSPHLQYGNVATFLERGAKVLRWSGARRNGQEWKQILQVGQIQKPSLRVVMNRQVEAEGAYLHWTHDRETGSGFCRAGRV